MDDHRGPIFVAPTREGPEHRTEIARRPGRESWVQPQVEPGDAVDPASRDEFQDAWAPSDHELNDRVRDDGRYRAEALEEAAHGGVPRDDARPGPVDWDPVARTIETEYAPRPRVMPLPGEASPEAPPRRRRFLWSALGLLLILALIWLVVSRITHQSRTASRFVTTGPIPVGTAQVQKGDMPVILRGLGTVTPLATVTVMTQINGQLTQVGFREGQMVKKGDFLAQIDPRPYQVALEQAEAQLAKDTAALNSAALDLRRYRILVAQNSIARQTAEDQAATVLQDQAVLKTDQAQIDTQKLNLAYCHIVAPVSGRVGLRQIDPGNYVQTTSTTGIVVITQLQPISVIFSLPEDDLTAVLPRLHAGATLSATVFDRTGTIKLDTGALETIDNQIDTTTGTVKFRAIFDNAHGILFPNQFVNVQLLVNTVPGTNIVPTSAVERGAPGTFVYVVKPNHTVSVQPVTLGPVDGQRQAITKGLTPGETVVTDGADRLKDGAKVMISTPGQGGTAKEATPPGKVRAHGHRRTTQ